MSGPERVGGSDIEQILADAMAAFHAAMPEDRARLREAQQADDERIERERQAIDASERQARYVDAMQDDPSCRLPAAVIERVVSGGLEPTEALLAVRQWRASEDSFLAMLGPTGIGKTVAAWWLMRVCATSRAIVSARDAADAYAYTHEGSRRERARIESAGLLVIDEMGTERDEVAAQAGIFDVIDARQRGSLKTLMLGNLTPSDFRARYGARTVGRIREGGRIIGIAADSMRGER